MISTYNPPTHLRIQYNPNRPCFEKVLEEVTRYTPRYMEEMESIFDESQEEDRKRISNDQQWTVKVLRHCVFEISVDPETFNP
ncbi:unnamed protein product [Coregonus sp. 'balchen']|nr:unnamed protein product [Coregonus sp. 'balchen']